MRVRVGQFVQRHSGLDQRGADAAHIDGGGIRRGVGVIQDDNGVGAGEAGRPVADAEMKTRRADGLGIVIERKGRRDGERVGAVRREGERLRHRVAIDRQRPIDLAGGTW